MPTRPIPPLPAEPMPPYLATQETAAEDAGDLAASARWRYRLRYGHTHAAQDEVVVGASFNVMSSATVAVDDAAPPRTDVRLCARLDYSDDDERIDALRLVCESDEPGPRGEWPEADIEAWSSVAIALGHGEPDGLGRRYPIAPPLEAGGMAVVGLTWRGLRVADQQNARAALTGIRNRGLGGDAPNGEVVVYRTATVEAAAVAVPLIQRPQPIDISALGDTVAAALAAALVALFGDRSTSQILQISVAYRYSLTPDADTDTGATASLPVLLLPRQPFGHTTMAELVAAMARWQQAATPPTTRAVWAFSLAQFSQFDTQAAAPLLELHELVWPLR